MDVVQKIPENELEDFITIAVNAYPGFGISTDEERKRFTERLRETYSDPAVNLYGLYRDGVQVGGMLLLDFWMNVFSVVTLTGGVGMIAVDLNHKKEKVCKGMISFFLNHYRERGAFLTSLYPFRPDFYKEMGFGFGTQMHQYRIAPSQLPRYKKEHIKALTKNDGQAILDCYNRYMQKTHGLIQKTAKEINRMFGPKGKVIGYKEGDFVRGYVSFGFEEVKENFIINDLEIHEIVYESKEILLELLTFLHTQRDQIRHIIINTQDEYFHHLLRDPRNASNHIIPSVYHESSASGVGIMYRVIDVKRVFTTLQNHSFGGETCKVNLCIQDTFLPENHGEVIVHFEEGKPHLGEKEYEVKVQMDISDFSSLVIGVVPFKRLYTYGAAQISGEEYVDVIDRIFRSEEKPLCMTDF